MIKAVQVLYNGYICTVLHWTYFQLGSAKNSIDFSTPTAAATTDSNIKVIKLN